MPAVPTLLPEVGKVVAALPVRLSTDDPSEWVVVCRRTDVPSREFSTHTVQVLVDEQLATNGHYDLTYEQAMADLLERAGIVPPVDDLRDDPDPALDASYVIGQPVVVNLHKDGTVRFAVDLSDVDRARDVGEQTDWDDDEVGRVCEAVSMARKAHTYTITED
jgi:hypothetical protein